MNVYFYRDVMKSLGDQLIEDLLYNYARKYGPLRSIDYLEILSNLKIQLFACTAHIEMLEAPYCKLNIQHQIKMSIFYAKERKV